MTQSEYEQFQTKKLEKIRKFLQVNNLIDFVADAHLPPFMIPILTKDERQLSQDFPEVYSNLQSCQYASDYRTLMQYANDIISSWIIETYVMNQLSAAGIDLHRKGCDKDYSFLSGGNVTQGSDFEVTVNGKSRPVELICNYTDYWRRNWALDMRDRKYEHLCVEGSILIGVSTELPFFLCADMREDQTCEVLHNYKPYGGKDACRLTIYQDMIVEPDWNKLADKIKQYIT